MVAVGLVLAGCHRSEPLSALAPDGGFFIPKTTDAVLAEGNFFSRIAALESIAARVPDGGALNVQRTGELVDQLLARAQVFGQLEDYDEAEAWVARLDREAKSPSLPLVLLRAKVRASLHRFNEADAALDAAEKLSAPPKILVPLRASLLQARGQLDEAVAEGAKLGQPRPGILELGNRATLLAALGQDAEAERDFDQAVRVYADVSPMPIAWVYFQRGLARERRGDLRGAEAVYAVAHQVFPKYAPAAGHLAQMRSAAGDDAGALALLEPLVKSANDPEYVAQLATVLGKSDPPRSEALRAAAKASYETLLAKHPDAFADHAARFYLATEPARALELAKKNLAVRQTAEALELALDAALSAGNHPEACALAGELLVRPRMSERLRRRGTHVQSGCGK